MRGASMPTELTNFEILRDIDRRIAELQNTHDRNLGKLQYEFRLFHQVTTQYHTGILQRLEQLEARASKPMIDWQALLQNMWFKVAILVALATGNTKMLELVSTIFQKL